MHDTSNASNSTIKEFFFFKFPPNFHRFFPDSLERLESWDPRTKNNKDTRIYIKLQFYPALNSKLQDRELQRVQIARDISTSDFEQRVNAAKYITLTFHISMENLIRLRGREAG